MALCIPRTLFCVAPCLRLYFEELGGWGHRCVCVLAMDFDYILRVAERRIKAALGEGEAGKILFS